MPRRFFIHPEAIALDSATLSGQEAHHLLHVLRLKKGARIELFDGSGNIYAAEITATDRDKLSLAILATVPTPRPRPELHLAPGLLKGKKLELVLQKAVELGVTALQPFISAHCDRQSLKDNAAVERWQRIVLEACKQCGQTLLPRVTAPVSFPELLLNSRQYDRTLLCYEKETAQKISDAPLTPITDEVILLITGPEGGFSDDEICLAQQNSCTTVSLGPLTLRAETAAIAAVVILQHRLGLLG